MGWCLPLGWVRLVLQLVLDYWYVGPGPGMAKAGFQGNYRLQGSQGGSVSLPGFLLGLRHPSIGTDRLLSRSGF